MAAAVQIWRRWAPMTALGVAAALAMAAPGAAVNTALWGFAATADGGKAESCTVYDDDEKACAIVFCRGDGVLQLALEPTSAAALVEDQPGFAAVGERIEQIQWALVEGLEPGKPLWIADLAGVGDLIRSAAGQPFMSLGIGPEANSETPITIRREPGSAAARETLSIQGGASTTYHFTTASSELALQLLELKCRRLAASAAATADGATPAE